MSHGPLLELRAVREHDFAVLGRLTRDAYCSTPGAVVPQGYLKELTDVTGRANKASVWVLTHRDLPVGGVTYVQGGTMLANLAQSNEAEIRMLAVDPSFQGRGAGRLLLHQCIEQARAEGAVRLWLEVADWMVRAQRLYRSAGFLRAQRHDRTVGTGDAVVPLLAYQLDRRAFAHPGTSRPLSE
jgi:ribosomal protein S18 acetylase RimI-like enzyme